MNKNKNPYHFNTQYCLRVPLLCINIITNIFEGHKIGNEILKFQWENSLLREAIFLASPYLHEELSKLYSGKINDIRKTERLKQTFLKYILRASTRCTPFGLFSGVSVGSFSETTNITIKDISEYNRHTRLDKNYIVTLIDFLEKNKDIRNKLLYYPNSTLYPIANQYRYIEYKIQNNEREYSLEAIEKSSYVEVIIEKSKKGKTISELADVLIDDEISKDDATEFINQLIDNQILVSELEPSVSGKESLNALLETLKPLNKKIYKNLNLLKAKISLLDNKVSNSKSKYLSVYKALENIGVDFNEKYVLQTDLFIKTKQNNLHYKYGNTILKALPLLCKINSNNTKHQNLNQFKKRFIKRYETKEILLVKALDIESGIGYIQNNDISTVPFLNDISPKKTCKTYKSKHQADIQDFLHKKLIIALSSGIHSIELFDTDFSTTELDWKKFPNTFSSLVELTFIKDQEYIIINSIGGTNATNLLSRFCYGDKELETLVKDICDYGHKTSPEKVLAEIVHLPEARVGNILQRPHLRKYEIPYLAKSYLPKSNQININDITISVRNDKIVLKSKSLNKEILPRLTNAHNYSYKSLPIYHFLCDLQSQDTINNISFSWGFLNESYPFLPRVTYKKIILSKARWYVEKEEIQEILNSHDNENILINATSSWREKRKLPKLVQLKEGDNLLLINLENIDTIRLLVQQIKSKKKFILEEFLMEKTTVIKRQKRRFVNQFVFTFQKKTNT